MYECMRIIQLPKHEQLKVYVGYVEEEKKKGG